MNETGKPAFFNLDAYYKTIDGYINSDEVEIAQYLIAHPPAYFRDHKPERLIQIKARLNRQLWTPVQYKGIYEQVTITEEHTKAHWPTRGAIIEQIVRHANNYGIIPNIMELAPGSLWLPTGLKHKGWKFTYERLSLDDDQNHGFDNPDSPKYNIFVAAEIIEHLHNENEILQNYYKFDKEANFILITTPLYTYGGGMSGWEERELGHLRAYCPSELETKVKEMFPGYRWQIQSDEIIHAIGQK